MKTTLFLLLLLISQLLLPTHPLQGFEDTILSQYIEAEKATDKESRQKLFNQALEAYLKLPAAKTSATLNYNIANCYFQLSEYALAILYYNRALILNPRLTKAEENLQIAYKKIGLQPQKTSFVSQALFFHTSFSIFQRKILLFGSTLFSLVFASLFLWLKVKIFRSICFFSLICSALLFISIIWSLFLSPVEAIIIQPTNLQKDAGFQYTAVSTKSLYMGKK